METDQTLLNPKTKQETDNLVYSEVVYPAQTNIPMESKCQRCGINVAE